MFNLRNSSADDNGTPWTPLPATDLRRTGKEPGTCDRCGRNDLRFLHPLTRPGGGVIHVGCECARRLCRNYSPEAEERKQRNLWVRRCRWPTRKWRLSKKGNEYLQFLRQGRMVRVTVFMDCSGCWSYSLAVGEEHRFSAERFESSDAAKLASFDALEHGFQPQGAGAA